MLSPLRVKVKIARSSISPGALAATACLLAVSSPGWGAFEGLSDRAGDRAFGGAWWCGDFQRGAVRIERVWRFGLPELATGRCRAAFSMGDAVCALGWYSAGDDTYRENQVSFGLGYRRRGWSALVSVDRYLLRIEGYGSASAPGVSVTAAAPIGSWVLLSGGASGLWTGRVRRGCHDISRIGWMEITLRGDSAVSLAGSVEAPLGGVLRSDRVNCALAVRGRVARGLKGVVLMAENPARAGVGLEIPFGQALFYASTVFVPRLGSTQRLGLGFEW